MSEFDAVAETSGADAVAETSGADAAGETSTADAYEICRYNFENGL